MNATSHRTVRQAVVNGVKIPIYAPQGFRNVYIGNATSADLQVHSTDDDNAHYFVVSAGFERPLPGYRYVPFQEASVTFWLTSGADGTVVLIWC